MHCDKITKEISFLLVPRFLHMMEQTVSESMTSMPSPTKAKNTANATALISDEESGVTEMELLSIEPQISNDASISHPFAATPDDKLAQSSDPSLSKPPKRKNARYVTAVVTILAIVIVCTTAPLLYQSMNQTNSGLDVVDPTATETSPPSSDPSNANPDTSEEHYIRPAALVPFDNIQLPSLSSNNNSSSSSSSSSITQGYSNRSEFEAALTEVAKYVVNKVVLQNTVYKFPLVGDDNGAGWGGDSDNNWRGSQEDSPESLERFFDATDYETNNQERGVDEADLIKADDNYVYAAYKNFILVWDTNGNQVAQVKITKEGEEAEEEEDSANNFGGSSMFSGGFAGGLGGGVGGSSGDGSTPSIESMLLVNGLLVVVVSGVAITSEQDIGDSTGHKVIQDWFATEIRTYETSSIPIRKELALVGSRKIHGQFVHAQSVGTQIHLTTRSGIDTYTDLMKPFQRYSNYPSDIEDEEYVERVRFQALEKYIPRFVDKMSQQISYLNGSGQLVLPNLLKLYRWQESANDSNNWAGRSAIDSLLFSSGLIRSATWISSFDVTATVPMANTSQLGGKLAVRQSCFFGSSPHVHVYGTPTKLVVASTAWNWNNELNAAEQATQLLLLQMEVNSYRESVSTSFKSVGAVRGTLLNPYSLDIAYDNEIRVATTVRKRWGLREVSNSSSGAPVDVSGGRSRNTYNLDDHYISDRGGLQQEKIVEESTTENYITVIGFRDSSGNNSSSLETLGAVQLGEKDEVIMAVRFFDKVAYCVTSQQIAPFYVVDLETVSVLGEFKLNGFSNYLHPLNDDKTLLLGIGQNVSNEGAASGVMITVFNATDPTQPQAVSSFTVDHSSPSDDDGERKAFAHSVAQWDYKSFRYVDEMNKLIIPMNVVTYNTEGSTEDAIRHTVLETFDGFLIVDINLAYENGGGTTATIQEYARVSHATYGCHHCGSLPSRSFVYNATVMTTEGNIVSSLDLETAQQQWTLNVRVEGEVARCCF